MKTTDKLRAAIDLLRSQMPSALSADQLRDLAPTKPANQDSARPSHPHETPDRAEAIRRMKYITGGKVAA